MDEKAKLSAGKSLQAIREGFEKAMASAKERKIMYGDGKVDWFQGEWPTPTTLKAVEW